MHDDEKGYGNGDGYAGKNGLPGCEKDLGKGPEVINPALRGIIPTPPKD